MATYFVRKNGDDTTGDGSTGTPWLTLVKAIATIAAGDTVKVGDGTYQEDTGAAGYWNLNVTFATAVSFEGENGAASAVTVQGSSSATYNVRQTTHTKMNFTDIDFICRAGSVYAFVPNGGKNTTFNFTRCHIQTANASGSYGMIFDSSNAVSAVNITLTDCTGTGVNASTGRVIALLGAALNVVVTTLTNFVVTSAQTASAGCVWSDGVQTTLNVTGGSFTTTSGSSVAIQVGLDSTVGIGGATFGYGTITGATVVAAGHGILLGNSANGVVCEHNTITGAGDYGIVLKDCHDCIVRYNTVTKAAGTATIFVKGGTANTISYNTFTASAGYGLTNIDISAGYNVSNTTVTHNTFNITGTAGALQWSSDRDAAGNVVDFNTYLVSGTGTWGTVLGTTVSSLVSLRAAWDAYGDGTNDDHSNTGGSSAGVLLAMGIL